MRRGPWTRVTPPRPPVDGQFRQPTDVTWDPEGNIFISDGYINSRVAKFDKNGDWVKSFGDAAARSRGSSTRRTASPPTPRATSMWRIAATGASRCSITTATSSAMIHDRRSGSSRVHIRGWARMPNGRATGSRCGRAALRGRSASRPGPTQYLYSADAFPGRIYKLTLDGKVLGLLGSIGPPAERVRLDSRIGVPVGERNLRG